MAQKHTFELIAEELAEWIEEMAHQLADSVLEGPLAPFAVKLSEADKLAYYASSWWLPDGTPNAAFRQATIERVGPDGFEAIVKALLKERGTQPPALIPTTAAPVNPARGYRDGLA